MEEIWCVIHNPISGRNKSTQRLERIKELFKKFKLKVEIISTNYAHHEEKLVQVAIKQGFTKFICIGGDGTIHHMVNAIMKQDTIASKNIQLGVIPTGTGNDWVKNYQIPCNPEKAIKIILAKKTIYQEIGKITFLENNKKVFFNNAAGIGFDAYVVKRISRYKKYGSFAYLLAALSSLNRYRRTRVDIQLDKQRINSITFMLSIGICKFSGGGMQLTDYKNRKTNYFNITLLNDIKLFKVIRNIIKLYSGKIDHIEEVRCFKTKEVHVFNNQHNYVQADGELLGKGSISIQLIPEAIQFIIP